MLKQIFNLTLVAVLLSPALVSASGTYISFPPKPKAQVDCKLVKNADKPQCKKGEK
jgi:hypothetical protein